MSAGSAGLVTQSAIAIMAEILPGHEAGLREVLDAIFAHCRDYPGPAGLLDFLRRQTIPIAAEYTNTIGRTVEQIHREADLREQIQRFLDRTPGQWRAADPRRVRRAIQEFVW